MSAKWKEHFFRKSDPIPFLGSGFRFRKKAIRHLNLGDLPSHLVLFLTAILLLLLALHCVPECPPR